MEQKTFIFNNKTYILNYKQFDPLNLNDDCNFLLESDIKIIQYLLSDESENKFNNDFESLLIKYDCNANHFMFRFIRVMLIFNYDELLTHILNIFHEYNKIQFEKVRQIYTIRLFKNIGEDLYYKSLSGLYGYKMANEKFDLSKINSNFGEIYLMIKSEREIYNQLISEIISDDA